MSIGQRSYQPGLCLRWARKPDGDSVLGSWVGRVPCYYQVGVLRMAVMVSILLTMMRWWWWLTYYKHCQRHNGPEGWVMLNKVTSPYTNLNQIPKFKISTKHQHFDQILTSKSWPNNHFITSPNLSSKILTKLQFQNFAWTSDFEHKVWSRVWSWSSSKI